ncbi:hypothetical protein J2W97_001214 [Paenibacillus jamilae]|nr:hypothetical protein [Paenibacillus jamilae]
MKVKLTITIEIDEKKYPNLTKETIRTELQGNFDLYMQQVEEETKNLLTDMNRNASK